jgi:transposase-like protein
MRPKGTRTFASRLNETERQQIVAWSNEGLSQTEIARRLGCNRDTVFCQQKRLGCLVEYRRPVTDELRREILAFHNQGLSSEPIAQKTGVGARTVLRVLREAGTTIKARRPLSPEKRAAIDADLRGRKDFLCRLAKKHGVGTETVRRRKKAVLGDAPLKSTWPPLQSKFSQIDAADYVPSPQDVFAQIIHKCIDMIADKLLRQGRNRDEVIRCKRALKLDPTPILDCFNAGLREAAATLHLEQVTAGHLVH